MDMFSLLCGLASRPPKPVASRLMACLLLLGIFCGQASAGNPRRVALLGFSSDANSWQTGKSLADLSVLVQAGMSSQPGIQWVERSELAQVQKELELSALRGSPSEGLQLARWIKADWYVVTRISRNVNGARVEFEIVDVSHADVLATHEITLVLSAGDSFSKLAGQIKELTAGLDAAIGKAAQRENAVAGLPSVAVLFYPNLENFDIEFNKALSQPDSDGKRLRVLRFPRLGVSGNEASIVLDGLAEDKDGEWKSVADFYLWGALKMQETGSIDGEVITDAHTPAVDLTLWDGSLSRFEISEKGKPVDRANFESAVTEEAQKLAAGVLRLTKSPAAKNPPDEQRRIISRALLREAVDSIERKGVEESYLHTVQGRRFFFNLVQTLEAACFFDPDSRDARDLLLRTRWSRNVEETAKNKYLFYRARSEEWGRFGDRFGPVPPEISTKNGTVSPKQEGPRNPGQSGEPPRLQQLLTPSAACEYLASALSLLETASWGNADMYGFPKDISKPEKDTVIEELTREVARRAVKVGDQKDVPISKALTMIFGGHGSGPFTLKNPKERMEVFEKIWPRLSPEIKTRLSAHKEFREDLRQTLIELNQAGDESKLFAGLPAAQVHPPDGTGEPVQAVPISAAPSSRPQKEPGPERWKPEMQTFDAPEALGIYRVRQLVLLSGSVWVIGEGSESTTVGGMDPEIVNSLNPTQYEAKRLFRLNPENGKMERVAVLAKYTPETILAHEGKLWLALGKDGVARLDPASGSLKIFGKEDGLNVSSAYQLAGVGPLVFATADMFKLVVCDTKMDRWKEWPVPDPTSVGIHQLGVPWLGRAAETLLYCQEAVFLWDVTKQGRPGNQKVVGKIGSQIWSDAQAKEVIWLGTEGMLFRVDTRRDSITQVPLEPTGPAKTPLAMVADGDYLWVALGGSAMPSEIAVLHVPTGRWICRFIANRTTALAVDDRYLWLGDGLGYGGGKKCLHRILKQSIYDRDAAH